MERFSRPRSHCAAAVLLCASLAFLATADAKNIESDVHTAPVRFFAMGAPKRISDLPPGLLRQQISALPSKTRERALEQLQHLEFSAEDVALLRVNRYGTPYFAETLGGALDQPSSSVLTAKPLNIPANDVFRLHSRPDSQNVVFLDFDGGALHPDSEWNSDSEIFVLQPFDPAANDPSPTEATFTTDELSLIVEIWHRIAEDFAAFDIDVTTEEPAVFTPTTGRIAFTHFVDANGRTLPGSGGGGIAHLNTFGQADYPTRYSPALVYYTNLSSESPGNPAHTAELGSHEFGHHLGLTHDGASIVTYYSGHGSGMTSWAPIMGAPFDRSVTTWSRGDYPGANNTQDDLAVILGKLGPAPDDHGDDMASATQLVVEGNGDILVSTPEIDPFSALAQNKGSIEMAADRDWFSFDVEGNSQLSVVAKPAWAAFQRDTARGANLDLALTLLDDAGAVIDSANPLDDTSGSLFVTLPAGSYFLEVSAVGTNTVDGYSNYASQGMYFLEGAVTAVGAEYDTRPPSPSTMAFASPPDALAFDRVQMAAVLATDESGGIEYRFSCAFGDAACRGSGWQSSRSWEIDGLSPSTEYGFQVRARDVHGNVTTASPITSVVTPALPLQQPPVAVARYEEGTAVIQKGKHADVRFIGTDSSDPDGTVVAWQWKDAGGNVLSAQPVFTLRLTSGTHTLTLLVTDDDGLSNQQSIEAVVAKAGESGGGEDDSGGGNGGGKGKKPRG